MRDSATTMDGALDIASELAGEPCGGDFHMRIVLQ